MKKTFIKERLEQVAAAVDKEETHRRAPRSYMQIIFRPFHHSAKKTPKS